MNVTIRKFAVGFIALAALIGVYLLYTRTNRTPHLEVDLARTASPPVIDANADSQNDVGTVLGVGVGRVELTRFLHRNERNQVDRDLGFEQLLHQQGNQWEITNPYLKLFFPTFQCIVTANRGKVQVETAFSRPMASDALFSGNVVIHIVPSEPNDALECFIHLDDVGFLAAKSLFSSTGAVHFLSRRAQLTGTGMELIYDEARSRLELFRIFTLDSLRLRSREMGSVANLTPRQHPGNAAPSQDAASGQTPVAGGPAKQPDDRYQCILHRNVAIAMPDRVVMARDELAIDNILWSGSKKPDVLTRPALDPNDPNAAPYPGPNALDTTASSHSAISSIPPEFFDTVVTCDGGFEVTPMGSRVSVPARHELSEVRGQTTEDRRQRVEDGTSSSVVRPLSSGSPDRQRASAQRIHFNAFTTDTILDGPVEMAFPLDPNSLQGAKAAAKAMPMTITAQKNVRFLAAASQVLLDGDCKVTLSRSEPNLTYEYVLTAPRLVLDIASEPNKAKGVAVSARKLVTDGGPAALRILRKGPDRLLGWTTLDAAQLQYEADSRQFTALGPGEIWIRNDEMTNAKADPNQFSLGRPCIALLTNWDTLKYFAATNQIIAEDDSQQLLLDYFPLTDGKYNRQTRTVAGHVEASLKEIAKGHLELATLTATKGIEYEDETGGLSFVGSTLSYDYAQSLVAVRGDDEQPCFLNGALVDQIDLNLRTGRIQAEIPGPSVFQIRR
ncbi:MAG: hypothetical protein NTZ17_21025 [Phycisphaerae bacterium]|nr:hypothetical protein [Phycisphaerae bacterium]